MTKTDVSRLDKVKPLNANLESTFDTVMSKAGVCKLDKVKTTSN